MSWSAGPTLAGFTTFIYTGVQIDPLLLPTNSPYNGYAFDQAMATVISVPACNGIMYTDAVYNCGTHILFRIAPDQTGRDFFREKRAEFGLLKLSAGVVQSASDESTSETLAVPDALKQLSLGDLQFLRTPWGRAYLEYAQDFGGIWGLS